MRRRTSPTTWRSTTRSGRPGARGAVGAARWFAAAAHAVRLRGAARRRSRPHVPGQGPVRLPEPRRDASPASRSKTIVVMAHRDDAGTGPGANDNASGTGALVELARTYAPAARQGARSRLPYTPALPLHGRRRRRRARSRRVRGSRARASNVIARRSTSTRSPARAARRMLLTGDTPHSPAAGLVETVRLELSRRDRLRARAATARRGSSSTSRSRSASTNRRRSSPAASRR